jgi:hypothetical protein
MKNADKNRDPQRCDYCGLHTRIAELESELGEYKARNPYNIIADRDARIANLEAALYAVVNTCTQKWVRDMAKEALGDGYWE